MTYDVCKEPGKTTLPPSRWWHWQSTPLGLILRRQEVDILLIQGTVFRQLGPAARLVFSRYVTLQMVQ